jgi:oligoendopeptidase F
VLHNAEMPRPEATLSSGETVELTPTNFQAHRTTPHRGDRMLLFPAYFAGYDSLKETLGHNLQAGIATHLFRKRVRRYGSCLEAALDGDHIPLDVYRRLIEQVRERLPLIHRYFRLRAQSLGVSPLEYPDMYCPLTATPPRRFDTLEARRLVTESTTPLGSKYTEALGTAFGGRWIDWNPAPGKRSGAYSSGWAYDVHPYVLLNFNGDYESVSTLAHEMGHAMHSYFSNRRQPYATADYSIFVAEVASTLNEGLLFAAMEREADSPEEKLFLVASWLDGIRGTLFRQTMFAEFELKIHERVEAGEPLTGEALNELYLDLLRAYHGHDEGVVRIDEAYAVEWAAIPHFYYEFYVYQYATGIVAANALAEGILAGGDGAAERYLEFLHSGGSDYPLELLRRAGVDLEAPEPYAATFAAMDRRLDQLEALLSK